MSLEISICAKWMAEVPLYHASSSGSRRRYTLSSQFLYSQVRPALLESFMIWGKAITSEEYRSYDRRDTCTRRGIEKNDMGYACAVGVVDGDCACNQLRTAYRK